MNLSSTKEHFTDCLKTMQIFVSRGVQMCLKISKKNMMSCKPQLIKYKYLINVHMLCLQHSEFLPDMTLPHRFRIL